MLEKFSMPEKQSKKLKKEEIEEGITEYLNTPKSKEGFHSELKTFFELEKTPEPLKRNDIEKEAENFIDKNFQKFLPILIGNADYGEIINSLGITNEDIGLLNANYYILRDENGKTKIMQDEYEVYSDNVSSADLLALAYAKKNIRTDTQNEAKHVGSKITHRYYFKPKNRYLCKNDFGMRVWDEEQNKMIEGDVCDVTPFIQTLKYQFARIQENLTLFSRELKKQIQNKVEKQIPQINEEEYKKDEDFWKAQYERESLITEIVQHQVQSKLLKLLSENPKDKELLLKAVSTRKIMNHLYFNNYYKIAHRYKLITDNPIADYEKFNYYGHKKIEKLLQEPVKSDKEGASLNFLYSDFYHKPVIIQNDFEKNKFIAEIKSKIKDLLAYNAVQATPEIEEIFNTYRCRRGEQSIYFYHDYKIYDFIKEVGIEKTREILSTDDRDIFKQINGYIWLRTLGYDLSRSELNKLKKQIYEAYKLSRSNIWEYLAEKEGVKKDMRKNPDWLKEAGVKKARKLFFEGKRMYWLALQVYKQNPNQNEGGKFYYQDSYIDWSKYDLAKTNISEKKLNEYFNSHKNLIIALLCENPKDEKRQNEKPATLDLIIQALESGQNLRGAAIAYNKRRYLEKIIKEKVENDLEFALQDWPTEWKNVITKEEITLYYEYADDYILFDPNGLIKYAQWKAKADRKKWPELFNENVKRKSDLDFRICLASQNNEVQEWYRRGTEHVGNKIMQSYLMRFNATRDMNGQLADWHDTLFWVPYIHNLNTNDAKSILNDIQTMDENQEFIQIIQKYNKEKDPFADQPIQSLRELKKRIIAIESNIDLSKFPPELINITTAPGFNLSALESMMDRKDFQELLAGKMDAEQPFKPHKRIFVNRNLSDILQEGLGSYRKKIRGTANSPKQLFNQLRKLIKDRTINGRKMTVNDLMKKIPIDLEEEIILLLQKQNVNIGPIIEAQIHAKSDTDGWVCGNYTDCCMPFGTSKNTDYMFNPSTQYFTIKYNGRIIAQSVVVDAIDKRNNSDIIILDNIEVANNYKKFAPLLSRAYQIFWTEYTSKPVKIGTGYSDLIPPGCILEENNFSSKTKLSYSDATGPKIYDLPKTKGVESADQIVSFANLTEKDVKLITKMETKAYPDGMKQGKSHILDIIKKQRELGVPGAASSFIVRKGNEPAGYLLVLPEKSEINPNDEKVAHIYDMVVLPKFQGTNIAKKIMKRVLDIASAYNVSIEAEARATTSYALLMNKRVQKWIKSNGFILTKNEKLPKYLGNEDFYFVRFENIKQNN